MLGSLTSLHPTYKRHKFAPPSRASRSNVGNEQSKYNSTYRFYLLLLFLIVKGLAYTVVV